MPITINYGRPGPLLVAGYAAGKNRSRIRQQAYGYQMLMQQQRFKQQQAMEAERFNREAYLHAMDWQGRMKVERLRGGGGNVLDVGVPEGGPDPDNPLGIDGQPLTAKQRADNAAADRRGLPRPWKLLPASQPKSLEERKFDEMKQQHGEQNQLGRDRLEADKGWRNTQQEQWKLEHPEDVPEPGMQQVAPEQGTLETPQQRDARINGGLGKRGGVPLIIKNGKPVTTFGSDGDSGKPQAATGLGGTAPSATPDFAGEYNKIAANLNQQLQPMETQGQVGQRLWQEYDAMIEMGRANAYRNESLRAAKRPSSAYLIEQYQRDDREPDNGELAQKIGYALQAEAAMRKRLEMYP